MAATVVLSDRLPEAPNADFAFEIDFVRGEGPASRVFSATMDFIRACEAFDAELVQLVAPSIKTVLTLEDVESGSIRTWLRSALTSLDDEALKSMDWKKQVGRYLVAAKYVLLRWCDDQETPHDLAVLRKDIRDIAAETDVLYLPTYAAPSYPALIAAVRDFQVVKDRLIPGDRAKLIDDGGQELEMNLAVKLPIQTLEDLAVGRVVRVPAHQMVLPVKKPDYLGDSMWELRHGKRNIPAKILDADWLRKFQARQVDVRPGDSLLCMVEIEIRYGHDNELIEEHYSIIEVLDVLRDDRFTLKQSLLI